MTNLIKLLLLDEIDVLKRGFTIIDDGQNKDNNNNVIKGK